MPNTVITIARRYGSGGRVIGQKLAKEMDIAYYDRNIIYLTSDKSGVDPQFFSMHDENVKPGFFERLTYFSKMDIPPESRRFTSRENVFLYQQKMIRELAEKSDCVIIGRCGNYTLKNCGHNLLRVFIWAPEEVCITNVMRKLSIPRADAEKMVNDINKHRREYVKYYTKVEWESARNYDLCINSSEYSTEEAIELIRRTSQIMGSLGK